LNYQKIYNDFIADRLLKQPVKPTYFEKHHIIPKSMGGGNEASNIINLTAEDHIFAHILLAKAYDNKSMWAAVKFIFGNSVRNKRCPTRREIRLAALARENFARLNSGENNCNYGKPMSEEQKEKLRKANVGKKHTEEHRMKITNSLLGNTYAKGYKFTDEQKLKLSLANTGKKHTEESKQKISEKNKGKVRTPEMRKKLSDAKKGIPRTWVASEETRLKLSLSLKGRIISEEARLKISKGNTGKKRTDEDRQKLSELRKNGGNARAVKVICETTGEIFDCIKEAAEKFNIIFSTLRGAFNKKPVYEKNGYVLRKLI